MAGVSPASSNLNIVEYKFNLNERRKYDELYVVI